ncbi:hypothetical protein [Senegalia massiliensis]|uniref:TRASH domain-containing protein n=1 Tax=Senegalia massiliensis TaxID=1720316 RepID=A0A845QVJ3_9CLOT|nr:hypothetical protein [Senegalia massiliensis]NBI06024.1 hypothetical protein [Senegalia massiliensis]
MELLTGAFRVFLLYVIFTNTIRIIYALVNRKKIAAKLEEIKNDQEKAGIDESKTQKIVEQEIEYVTDPICNKDVNKDNAYIVLEEDENKYFCSWDCRAEYIDKQNKH